MNNNTHFPPKTQAHPDYMRSTRLYAMDALGMVGEQIDEFIRVDRALDWFQEDPERINRDPIRYAALQTRYQELNTPAVAA